VLLVENSRGGMKVGELAHASGLSIRTLRYYDELGLLTPSRRSPAGHRVYDDHDVQRLYRICLLRRAGLALAEIGKALDEPSWDLRRAMLTHLQLLDHQQAIAAALHRRLTAMITTGNTADGTPAEPPTTTRLLQTLEDMAMLNDDLVQRRISILVYEDPRWIHGELYAGDGVIWLHQVSPRFGLASPKTLGAATATTAVIVEDVDAPHRQARDAGADIVYPPVDQPYGHREYSARDPEGGLWSFMQPRES